MASAPTTLVSWVRAPAASATGVREPLLLIGKPWKKPGGQIGGTEPDHLLVGIDLRRQIAQHRHAKVRSYRQTTPALPRNRRSAPARGRRR